MEHLWSLWVPIIRFGRVMPGLVTFAVRAPGVGSRFVIATLSQASMSRGLRLERAVESGLRRELVLVDQPAEQVTAA